MLLDFLDRLRAKPLSVRKRIAFFTTVALSLVVASVWWNSWNAEDHLSTGETRVMASASSPWSFVGDTFTRAKVATLDAWNDGLNELKAKDLEYAAEGDTGSFPDTLNMESAVLEDESADPEGSLPTDVREESASETLHESASGAPLHTRPKAIESVAATGTID